MLVGALLNLGALIEELRWDEPPNMLLVCAGTFEEFALEDAFAAGWLIAEFGDAALTDSARAALAVAKLFANPLDALTVSRNGRALAAKGRSTEVEWCAQISRYSVARVDGRRGHPAAHLIDLP